MNADFSPVHPFRSTNARISLRIHLEKRLTGTSPNEDLRMRRMIDSLIRGFQ